MPEDIPLILGGHSFFSNLGNDPVPDAAKQIAIVETCLDNGITWFDTTHQPERSALGAALAALARRNEAKIFAWNFLKIINPGDKLDRPALFEPHHLAMLQEQLQTDLIDFLVVHDLDDGAPEEHARQEAVALEWKTKGYVGELGLWAPGTDAATRYGATNAFSFMIRPLSIARLNDAPHFNSAKKLGWRSYACSPFVRGWHLDKLVAEAVQRGGAKEDETRGFIADLMLRLVLFHPNVDRVITAIRKPEWVSANIESWRRGPLDEGELVWLTELHESAVASGK